MDANCLYVGFGHLVNAERLLAVVPPGAAPTKRFVQQAKEKHRLIDASDGHRLKAVLILDNGGVVLVAVTPATIVARASTTSSL